MFRYRPKILVHTSVIDLDQVGVRIATRLISINESLLDRRCSRTNQIANIRQCGGAVSRAIRDVDATT
jgi:hypothetical protein